MGGGDLLAGGQLVHDPLERVGEGRALGLADPVQDVRDVIGRSFLLHGFDQSPAFCRWREDEAPCVMAVTLAVHQAAADPAGKYAATPAPTRSSPPGRPRTRGPRR